MIKVLAVSRARAVMGTEHSLLNVAPLMAPQGVEMMLGANGGGSFERRWHELGLGFHQLALPHRQGFRPNTGKGYNGVTELAMLPVRTALAIARLVRLVRRSQADVIHSNCLITHLDCAIAGRITRARSVLELHEIVAPGIGRLAMGIAVRLCGRAVAISVAVRDQLPRWARGNVVVIPQSVDVSRFNDVAAPPDWRSRLSREPEQPIVAAVGRIDPEKGLHVLIWSVAMLRAAGSTVQLAVVGSPSKDGGGYLAQLQELGARLLGDAVRFVPQCDDVPGVLRAIDVLACPSVEEPFGLILLEAQASGVPVVATSAGGPLDFITHDETGLLVPPGDAAALAEALRRLITDPYLWERLAQAGQARARTRFTAEIRAQRFAYLYRTLTAGRS
ncbi:glycosyltransferase [Mycobacterium sp. djl-10]|nr:glycosyltransferase [Mycobacterium sp. djl-10]